jgi:hypothetical protein
MKTPSLDLFNFIHSMSSAEKRYFKKDTRDSNTLDLFDIINEMEEYDEDLVKSRLKDSSYAGNLKVHKNRLQQILLKNLRSFHEEKTAQSRIKVLIDNCEIFLKKKLYEQALSQLGKAIQYCESYEEYELKLQALGIKSRLSSYFTDLDAVEQTPILEMELCARQIQNYVCHAILNKQILHLINTSSLSKNELIERVEAMLNENKQKGLEPISSIAERMYLHSLAIISDLKGDLTTACKLTQQIVDKFESNPYIVEEKNAQYLNCIINYLDFCCRLPQARKEVEKYIEKAENHCSVYEHLQPNLLYVYFSYLECLRRERNFDTMTALYELKIKAIIANFQLEATFLAAKSLLLIVEAYFAKAHYDLAAELIRKLLNLKQAIPNDFVMAVHVIELLYHYEKFDFDFLEILIQSVQKKIRKLGIESRFLENLLNLFLKISNGNISDHKNLFQLYRTSLPTYSEDAYFKQLSNYIDFASWLDAQIRKQPYSLILKEKRREFL